MKIEIFRFIPRLEPSRQRLKRYVELFVKSAIMLIAPTPVAGLTCYIWYRYFYANELVFSEKMEVIITAAWIPVFGLLYSLLAAMVLNTVWSEYKEIRKAVKEYNLEKFVDLRDEDNSTLINVLILVVSAFVLGGFMVIHYPELKYGFAIVGSTAYLLALIYFVVKEIDDPCGAACGSSKASLPTG
jgi:hypothetical protein